VVTSRLIGCLVHPAKKATAAGSAGLPDTIDRSSQQLGADTMSTRQRITHATTLGISDPHELERLSRQPPVVPGVVTMSESDLARAAAVERKRNDSRKTRPRTKKET